MKTPLFGALLIGLTAGCAEVRDEIDDSAISIKSRTAALAAWNDSAEIFEGVGDEDHFSDGFRAGYFNAVKYGPANRPRLPRRYTGSVYRSRRGQQRVQAWIDGFAHGTVMAMENQKVETGRGLETVGYESSTSDPVAGESGEIKVSDTAAGTSAGPVLTAPKPAPATE